MLINKPVRLIELFGGIGAQASGGERMKLRTKGEQKAYLDGYEMCAKCIEKYLTNEGKKKLECFLMAVRNAVKIEDIEPQESEE